MIELLLRLLDAQAHKYGLVINWLEIMANLYAQFMHERRSIENVPTDLRSDLPKQSRAE